jgi:hypothetical protein
VRLLPSSITWLRRRVVSALRPPHEPSRGNGILAGDQDAGTVCHTGDPSLCAIGVTLMRELVAVQVAPDQSLASRSGAHSTGTRSRRVRSHSYATDCMASGTLKAGELTCGEPSYAMSSSAGKGTSSACASSADSLELSQSSLCCSRMITGIRV